MVLAFYGIDISGRRVHDLLGTSRFGTPAPRITRIERYGVSVAYRRAGSESELRQIVESGVPPICLVMTGALPYWDENVSHAVVVLEVGDDYVVLNDPADAASPLTVTLNAFMLAWVEQDYQFARIRPR